MSGPGFKMKAFTLNSSKKILSKKELEKAKQAEEEAATAEVFDEFVKAFEAPSSKAKVFVKGSTINPGTGESIESSSSQILYETSKMKILEEKEKSQTSPPILKKDGEKSLSAVSSRAVHAVS